MINLLNFPHNLKEILEEDDYISSSLKNLVRDIKSNTKLSDEEIAAILEIEVSELASLENLTHLTPKIKEKLKRLFPGHEV